jgi:CheY-like chemotaxis protein
MADVLDHLLRRAGHQPHRVEDGQQALERICAQLDAYDLLITDHQMPRLTGLGLVSKLRDTAFGAPIIVFSSMLTEAEADAYRALAVDYILTKPTQFEPLLRILHEIAARAVSRHA